MAGAQDEGTGAGSMESLRGELAALREALEKRGGGGGGTDQQVFDALYEELRQYKEDFVLQAERPLLLDLLLFYDSLNWFRQSLQSKEMSPDVVADSFQYLIDEFLELLYRRDVHPMEAREAFDRKNHKAVQVVQTEDPGLDYKVKQVIKRGFVRGERVLRPEEVVIHRHQAGGPSNPGGSS